MIAYLSGTVTHLSPGSCIVLAGSVGYEVFVPIRTAQKLKTDKSTELYIYTYVREDQLKLFGFETLLERDIFTSILSVSGVGPKIGLSILSSGTASEITKAISEANVSFFTKIKGLGKKNAQKIIIDLKSKLGSIQELDLQNETSYSEDVIEALQTFGFGKKEIVTTLESLDKDLPEPQLIKLALQRLGKA
ncbi:MAG: Holliday junction branch migration protein RuvA [Patescibacteria group bacterium]|jgi:Holliday junction DNA helicase RuvA